MPNRFRHRLGAFFSDDPKAYWWKHFTDKEKKLARKDVWELAEVIQRQANQNEQCEKIVAEHLLNVRLAKIQARASWVAAVIGLLGVVLGAVLTKVLS